MVIGKLTGSEKLNDMMVNLAVVVVAGLALGILGSFIVEEIVNQQETNPAARDDSGLSDGVKRLDATGKELIELLAGYMAIAGWVIMGMGLLMLFTESRKQNNTKSDHGTGR